MLSVRVRVRGITFFGLGGRYPPIQRPHTEALQYTTPTPTPTPTLAHTRRHGGLQKYTQHTCAWWVAPTLVPCEGAKAWTYPCQTWWLISASQRHDSVYGPGLRSRGTATVSMREKRHVSQ